MANPRLWKIGDTPFKPEEVISYGFTANNHSDDLKKGLNFLIWILVPGKTLTIPTNKDGVKTALDWLDARLIDRSDHCQMPQGEDVDETA